MATVRLKIERITQLRQHDPKSKALGFELCRLLAIKASLHLMPSNACTALDEMLKGEPPQRGSSPNGGKISRIFSKHPC